MRRWNICLEERPEVLAIGVGRHEEVSHTYKLNGLWCVHLYRYHGELVIGKDRTPIRPGCVSFIPPDTLFEHVWPERPAVHVSVHFRLRRGAKTVPVPLMQSLGDDYDRMWEDLIEAVPWMGVEDARLTARVWDVLWRCTSPPKRSTVPKTSNQTLDRAVAFINARLTENIDIGLLASEIGISHNHLIRLFRKQFGMTVQTYIRTLRAQKAKHLLVNTTMPVKVVAIQCGIPDLHGFNKTVRRVYGKSPTQLRLDGNLDDDYRERPVD